jgi:hypothetical protein
MPRLREVLHADSIRVEALQAVVWAEGKDRARARTRGAPCLDRGKFGRSEVSRDPDETERLTESRPNDADRENGDVEPQPSAVEPTSSPGYASEAETGEKGRISEANPASPPAACEPCANPASVSGTPDVEAAEPFGAMTVTDGAVSASVSAPSAVVAAISEADGSKVDDAIDAYGGLEAPEQRNPDHGPGGKFVVGNQAARTSGLHSKQQPLDVDGPDPNLVDVSAYRDAWTLKLWVEACQQIDGLLLAMRAHPRRVRSLRNVQHLVSLFEQVRALDAEVRAARESHRADRGEVFGKLARIFAAASHEEVAVCLQQMLAHEPALADVMRRALDEHDATPRPLEPAIETPKPKAPNVDGLPRPVTADDDDEMFL